ncbi:hypothetical protein [Helicobacter sp. 11S02596-1]|uniref:hypothetical protein n=1 Tax=Helicobacter sp. 11S02596-1 TaxID=1476194 RepID=UPI000BA5C0BF|nr:hypothetical protein [Helicobacter sp. 11S02596-1]PAF42798.1 hypothetical protein BJI48_05940 [Helicobacter sp. 11S02596-1]
MLSLEYIPKDKENDMTILQDWLKHLKVDFLIVPDSPKLKPTPEACLISTIWGDRLGVDVIASIAGSGRREERIESLLLGLRYAGIHKVAVVGGDKRQNGELGGWQLAKKAKEILGEKSFIICGSGLNLDKENKKSLENKIANGAKMIISQPAFDPKSAQKFLKSFEEVAKGSGVKVAMGFFPIYESSLCQKILTDNLGFDIPDSYRQNLCKDPFGTNLKLYGDLESMGCNIHLCGAKNAFIGDFIASMSGREI